MNAHTLEPPEPAKVSFPVVVDGGQFTWINPQVCRDPEGRRFGTDQLAQKIKRLPHTSLTRWEEEPCRFLAGRTLHVEYVTPPSARRVPKVRVYLIKDLDKIKEGRKATAAAQPFKDDQGTWLPWGEFCEELGVSRFFMDYWRKKPSNLRPGEKALRSERAINRDGRGPTNEDVFLLEDGRAILAGKESEHPGRGYSEAANRLRRERRKWAKKALRAILRKSGASILSDVWHKAQDQGFSLPLFNRTRRALKIKEKKIDGRIWLALPGQRFPQSQALAFVDAEAKRFPLPFAEVKARAVAAGIGDTAFRDALLARKIESIRTGGPFYLCRPGQEAPRLPLEKLNGAELLAADLRPYRNGGKTYWSPHGAFQKFPEVCAAFRLVRLCQHYLDRFRNHRSRVLGRTIDCDEVPRKNTRGKGWVYAEGDVLRLAEARLRKQAAKEGPPAAETMPAANRVAEGQPLSELAAHPVLIAGFTPEGKKDLRDAIRDTPESPRLVIDLETNCLTLDGVTYGPLDPPGLRIIDYLHKRGGNIVPPDEICGNVPGCAGGENNIRRALKRLPEPVRSLAKGRPGSGRRLQLPAPPK